MQNNLTDNMDFSRLTPSQLALLEYASTGMTNIEIANVLFVSINTVRNSLSAIYKKLGTTNRVKIVLKFLEYKRIRTYSSIKVIKEGSIVHD